MKLWILSLALFGFVAFAYQGDLPAVQPSLALVSEKNGDVNGDSWLNLTDAVYLLQWLYAGGPAPVVLVCESETDIRNGDVNGDSRIDLTDPIYLITYLYLGGPPLVEACTGQ